MLPDGYPTNYPGICLPIVRLLQHLSILPAANANLTGKITNLLRVKFAVLAQINDAVGESPLTPALSPTQAEGKGENTEDRKFANSIINATTHPYEYPAPQPVFGALPARYGHRL